MTKKEFNAIQPGDYIRVRADANKQVFADWGLFHRYSELVGQKGVFVKRRPYGLLMDVQVANRHVSLPFTECERL